MSDCMWALSYMADGEDIHIGMVSAGEVLPKVIECLGMKEYNIFVPSLRTLGNILTTNDPDIIDRALFEGALDKLTDILYANNTNLIKECLWAFSNITAGPPRHIGLFVESKACERVM